MLMNFIQFKENNKKGNICKDLILRSNKVSLLADKEDLLWDMCLHPPGICGRLGMYVYEWWEN